MSEPRINAEARRELETLAGSLTAAADAEDSDESQIAGWLAAQLSEFLARCTSESEPQADRAALEKLRERLDAEAVKYKTPGDHSSYDDYQQGRSAMADEACVELERIMLVAEGREPRCAQCGGSVEEMRHGWATPTCFGCLPESEDRPW